MKISIVCVGKIKENFYREAVAEYAKRLSRYCKLEIIEVSDEKTPENKNIGVTGHLATTEKSFYKSYAAICSMHNTDIKMADLYCQYTDTAGSIDKAIKEVIANSDFIKGEAVGKLESRLAGLLNTKHCITCGNGTDALFISMMATGIGQGDEVIVPAFSFGAVAEAVALLGGTPVFADVEADTFNMSADSAERMITPRTKAIVQSHFQ